MHARPFLPPRSVVTLLVGLAAVIGAPSARATQVAIVPVGTVGPRALDRVDVRDLGSALLWIAPDEATVAWPASARLLHKTDDEEFFLVRDDAHAGDRGEGVVATATGRELARAGEFRILAASSDDLTRAPLRAHCHERLVWLGPAPRAELRSGLRRAADPLVKTTLVNSVAYPRYVQIVRELSGALPAPVNGGFVSIMNRSTLTTGSGTHIDAAIDYLREQWAACGYVVLEQTFAVGSRTARNLIAARAGTVSPNEVVVVGAHYDSTSEVPTLVAPGSEDNATGSAAVVHLAEVFAGYETERTVHFVLFGGEEQGLYGSQYYVSQLGANGWTAVGALTMDMISAWRDHYAVIIEGQMAWKPLMDVFAANVTEFAQIPYTQTFFSFGSDHVPFQQAGIPAFLAIDDDWDVYADYHRSTDTYDKVDPTLGWKITRAIAGATVDLAGAAPRVSPVGATPPAGALVLSTNVPNPFNPSTEIHFSLPTGGSTELAIYDVRGRRVLTLLDRVLESGPGSCVWNGDDRDGAPVASGIYLARLRHPAGERVRRLVLVR